ncbi:MAG: AbrB/MazE/SpoVT family DNA-binding domain-containing protein [Pseudonocardia sp.]
MRTVIDAAGRLVIPKQARDELGLSPGTELELRVVDRRIEIEVPATAMRLVEDEQGVVAVTDRPMPVLTADMVRETLERVRR